MAGESTARPWGPVREQERIVTLDVLRGVAIFGMLLANIVIFAFPATSRDLLREGASAADVAIGLFLGLLVEGKFYTLFSILFGIGLALQSERAEAHGRPFAGVYVRRLLVLLGIGVVHGLLLSASDILSLYAIVGLVAILFRKLAAGRLLATAIALYATGVLALGVYAAGSPGGALPGPANWEELAREGEAVERLGPTAVSLASGLFSVNEAELYEFMADEERIFQDGTYAEMVRHRAVNYLFVDLPLKLVFVSWRVLGLFLLGIYFVKRGVFMERDRELGRYKTMLFSGLVLGLCLELVGGAAQGFGAGNVVALSVFLFGIFFGVPALSLAYGGALALVTAGRGNSLVVESLAAVGRTALTNYVGQSVICGLIFYSYGLAAFGRLSGVEAMVIAMLIFLFQMVVSAVWVRHFRFGPLEWLWRSLSYWQVQPLRR